MPLPQLLLIDSDDGAFSAVAEVAAPGAVRLRVQGEVDGLSSPDLTRALAAAERDDPASLVVDLDGVTFLNVSALAVLFAARDRARARGAAFAVRGLPRGVARFVGTEQLQLDVAAA